MKTTTAVVVEPAKIDFVRQELKPLGEHDLLIKMNSVGLCHSDVPKYTGTCDVDFNQDGYRYVKSVDYPCVIGHEPVATVVETGKAVTKFCAGQRVTGFIGSAFTEYMVISDAAVFTQVPEAPFDPLTCLGEPLGCTMNIVDNAMAESISRVAVVGCGAMGLMAIAALRGCNLTDLVAVDLAADKRELALQMGATAAVDPRGQDFQQAMFAHTDGNFFDAVIEITGSLRGLETAVSIVKFPHTGGHHEMPYQTRGRVVSASVYGREETFSRRLGYELMIRSPLICVSHPIGAVSVIRNIERGAEAWRSGKIPMDKLVTHRVKFEEIEKGFEWLLHAPENYVKGIVTFD
ncbi:MAG: zinc-binding dehydrogenase [Clostridiales bacterium]|nr:zinc-binding dehydrogenase [Clostridiales bacterium]